MGSWVMSTPVGSVGPWFIQGPLSDIRFSCSVSVVASVSVLGSGLIRSNADVVCRRPAEAHCMMIHK